jgi:hypothetical protein
VPTDVEERADGLVVPAHQDETLARDLNRLEAPWGLQVGRPRGAEPLTREDPFLLERIDPAVSVIVTW